MQREKRYTAFCTYGVIKEKRTGDMLVPASGWTQEKAAAVSEFILQGSGNADELIALLRI